MEATQELVLVITDDGRGVWSNNRHTAEVDAMLYAGVAQVVYPDRALFEEYRSGRYVGAWRLTASEVAGIVERKP